MWLKHKWLKAGTSMHHRVCLTKVSHRCTLVGVSWLNGWLKWNHIAYRLWLSYLAAIYPFCFHCLFPLWWILLIPLHLLKHIKAEPNGMMLIHINDVLMTCICDSDIVSWHIVVITVVVIDYYDIYSANSWL